MLDEQEIDLEKIDWNSLSQEEFRKLEIRLQNNSKALRALSPRKDRCSGTVIVKIQGLDYNVKQILYKRLSSLNPGKAKQKLIDEIVLTHKAIDSL